MKQNLRLLLAIRIDRKRRAARRLRWFFAQTHLLRLLKYGSGKLHGAAKVLQRGTRSRLGGDARAAFSAKAALVKGRGRIRRGEDGEAQTGEPARVERVLGRPPGIYHWYEGVQASFEVFTQ